MFWIINIIAAFFLTLILAGFMIPQILLISFRKNLLDIPDIRKIHTSAVPRLGGIAFVPVIFLSIAFLLGVSLYYGYHDLFNAIVSCAQTVSFCFCALFILYIVGLADDLVGVRYRAKFVVQIFCALLLIAGGLRIAFLQGMLFIDEVPLALSWFLTVLVTVFVINAVNLIDGIDGLASSLSSIALAVYGTFFYLCGDYLFALVSFATIGVLIPFFYFNVFGNPEKKKKIFMGDAGSLSIGIILCILGFHIIQLPAPRQFGDVSMILVAIAPLIIPCFDVIRVYFGRIKHHHNPFLPDKTHIHHKLLALGMTQRTAMLTIAIASVVFIVLNLALSTVMDINLVLLIDVLVWTFVVSVLPRLLGRRQSVA